jgi:DNA repair exonuclease SbcCD ATPase subunit
MEVTEGQLLSQDFGVGGPPATVGDAPLQDSGKTPDILAAEIRTIKSQTGRMVLNASIEVGRRLTEAKAKLPHGSWGEYLKNEVDYSPSQALSLLVIPDEGEREKFVLENDVEHMSVRELNEALKARDAAEEKAAAAEDTARGLREEAERLREELTDQARVYEAKLTSAGVEVDRAKAEAQAAQEAQEKAAAKAQRFQEALSEANASSQAAEEEHTRLLQELEELRNRPTEADTAAVEAARQAAIAEMTEKVDKAKDAKKEAEEKRKAAEESLKAAQKELADLKAKGPEVRELTQEEKDALTAEAVERIKAESAERMQALEKQLSKADPDTTTLMVLFKSWQETYTKMWETLSRIEVADSDKAQKLRGGIRKVLETALEQMA